MPPDGCLPERFLSKLAYEDRGYITPCWIWTASLRPDGRAHFSLGARDEGKQLAHRYAYERTVGDIPLGYEIDHLCCVPSCVNPAHLEAVTPEENKRRNLHKNQYVFATACIHGHDFTPENTRVESDGERACRKCARDRNRRYYARKAA